MRAVLVILDGLPPRHVEPGLTPNLCALAAEGAAGTGRSVMTSSTYPNHATFATGAAPAEHGILGNWVLADGQPRPAQDVGGGGPPHSDACAPAGLVSIAVVGDQHLVGVMGAAAATHHWPTGGVLPDDAVRDGHGYVADEELVRRAQPWLDAPADLLVLHLNEPDTACHVHGPDSAEARACFGRTDAALGQLVGGLRPGWDNSVVVVVSDHDQEPTDLTTPTIDLYGLAKDRELIVIPDGAAAVVWGEDRDEGHWLGEVDGVAGHEPAGDRGRIVWADPGRSFALPRGFGDIREPGQHGGWWTRTQIAVVAGGHPRARELAEVVSGRTIAAQDWGPTIATLLGVDLPAATGRSLLDA
jgi:arylsulfatase A-like enzyme